MAVIKRPNNRWQAKIRSLDGRRWWSLTVDTKREAERIEREMRESVNQGREWIAPRDRQPTSKLTLEAVVTAFVNANAHQWASTTLRAYGFALEQFIQWASTQALGVEALDEGHIRAWVGSMAALKPTSRRNKASMLAACWRWVAEQAPRRGWPGVAPFMRLRLRAPPRTPTFAPTWEEMDALIEALRPKREQGRGSPIWWRVALLQRFTGARVTEAALLTWDDYDEAASLIRFRPETTKGGYGGRTVPISPHLTELLKGWARDAETISGATLGQTNHCAPTFIRAWGRAGARPQVWDGQPTHALRKGFVSGMLRLRGEPQAVELYVGHVLPAVQAAYIDTSLAFNLEALAALIPPLSVS